MSKIYTWSFISILFILIPCSGSAWFWDSLPKEVTDMALQANGDVGRVPYDHNINYLNCDRCFNKSHPDRWQEMVRDRSEAWNALPTRMIKWEKGTPTPKMRAESNLECIYCLILECGLAAKKDLDVVYQLGENLLWPYREPEHVSKGTIKTGAEAYWRKTMIKAKAKSGKIIDIKGDEWDKVCPFKEDYGYILDFGQWSKKNITPH